MALSCLLTDPRVMPTLLEPLAEFPEEGETLDRRSELFHSAAIYLPDLNVRIEFCDMHP